MVTAPDIASKARAGQFVLLMVSEVGERIPLTIVDRDEKAGTITLIAQEIGLTTKLLGKLEVGESLYSLVGPLGHATPIKNYGQVILVGGGVGIAEIFPIAKAMKAAGNEVITIIGSRTKELLILENELKEVSTELHIATDDGTAGVKGFTTSILDSQLKPQTSNLVFAVGPIPMMAKVAEVTKKYNVKTIVSLNSLMIDGSGMCGGCRVSIKEEVKFTCVDGPEFDAQQVDWQELANRSKTYTEQEKHICKLTFPNQKN